jgi:hypothetical protein
LKGKNESRVNKFQKIIEIYEKWVKKGERNLVLS